MMTSRNALVAVSLIFMMFLVSMPLTQGCSDADYCEETLSDGTTYVYDLYGNDYGTYECTIFEARSTYDGIYISTVLEGYNVTRISNDAFSGCQYVNYIVVPEYVEYISPSAFSGCNDLTSVYFLGDAPEMSDAFSQDVKIYHLASKNGWDGSSICMDQYDEKYDDGSEISYVVIEGEAMVIGGTPSHDGSVNIMSDVEGYPVTSVGPYSFAGSSNDDDTAAISRTDVVHVVIPEGIEYIRERAFYYCGGMKDISIPDTMSVVMDEAFRMASSIMSVDIPDSVTYIGFESFRQCTSMNSICIPDSVVFIGEGAFKLCNSAENIEIGRGLVSISDWTFSYCESAENILILGNVCDIGDSAFYTCHSVDSICLPKSMKTIGSRAFFECTNLSHVELGNNLESIGRGAFSECHKLNDLVVPDTLSYVDSRAFSYCSGMSDIYFEGDMPMFGESVFLNTNVSVHCTEMHSESWAHYDGNVVVDGHDNNLLPVVVILAILLMVCAVLMIMKSVHN